MSIPAIFLVLIEGGESAGALSALSIPALVVLTEGEFSLPKYQLPVVPVAFFLLQEGGGADSTPYATLGSFVFVANSDAVQPGSDSGWNRELTIQQTRPLGSNRDVILKMALGSHTRQFVVRTSPARFLLLQALLATIIVFTDWSGNSRTVYVQTIRRDQGSRPYSVFVTVELVEQ